ncbi:Glutathione peroxidase [Sergentomyia squamirostris]
MEFGDPQKAETLYDFSAYDKAGNLVSLSKYSGQVLVITNVTTKCSHAKSQFKDFVELVQKYGESKNLRILAFDCNQFVSEDPDSAEVIEDLLKPGQNFIDYFDEINVNGSTAHPLWQWLKKKNPTVGGTYIKWNFTKFIVDNNGRPVERYCSNSLPMEMEDSLWRIF